MSIAKPNTVTRDDASDNPATTSAAQRQRAYRRRRRRAAFDAIGEETQASRVTLLTMLSQDLAALETGKLSEDMTHATRSAIKRVLDAIVTRYGIATSTSSDGETAQ